MRSSLTRLLVAAVILCAGLVVTPFLPATPVSAAAGWYDGSPDHATIVDCASLFGETPITAPGVNTWVGYRSDPDAAKPGPNDVYYVHVVVGGIGNSCAVPAVQIEIALPPHTTTAISAANPVFCWYDTGQIPGNCPQTLGTGNAGRVWVPNLGDPTRLWQIPTGHTIEVQVPVRSTERLMGENLSSYVQVLDGNDDPLLVSTKPVWVFGANQPGGGTPTINYPAPATTLITATTAKTTAYCNSKARPGLLVSSCR